MHSIYEEGVFVGSRIRAIACRAEFGRVVDFLAYVSRTMGLALSHGVVSTKLDV